jgi:single-strand DNA-binding protein
VYEVEVDEVGPSLRNATAKVTKTTRAAGASGGSGSFSTPVSETASAEDPWSAAPVGGGWSSAGSDDQPPFLNKI